MFSTMFNIVKQRYSFTSQFLVFYSYIHLFTNTFYIYVVFFYLHSLYVLIFHRINQIYLIFFFYKHSSLLSKFLKYEYTSILLSFNFSGYTVYHQPASAKNSHGKVFPYSVMLSPPRKYNS
mgnify:CR=1 FL=1